MAGVLFSHWTMVRVLEKLSLVLQSRPWSHDRPRGVLGAIVGG